MQSSRQPDLGATSNQIDLFRPVEKKYRHRGEGHKNARQRRRERHLNVDGVDYSDVIDLHDLDNNTVSNRSRIRSLPVLTAAALDCTILDPTHTRLYEIEGLSGLRILINAMPRVKQVEWALRAVHDYSRNPFTNVSNLAQDRGATKDLWDKAWRDASDESWKAFHALRWANVGRHYDWTAREYLNTPDMPPLPSELKQLVQEVYAVTDMATCKPGESGIVNFYPAGTMMGGHLDNAEEDMVNPIVSLSLGTRCIYLQGGFTRDIAPTPIWLQSGDIVIMGGDARRCFHGVPLVTTNLPVDFQQAIQEFRRSSANIYDTKEIDAFEAYIVSARININLRRVHNNADTDSEWNLV
ncbi:Aste57867_21680 [Aphanomyces stellatus]|uniref:Aste57867_21680 protein n=1 Tax=Aphanomyces stellatus TaxID=120398 RepID=A0A485LIV4_9STRA|nr:hypothetical protein As57867_021611 [Aphanomyces stellatus]VFT98349.1 Aste57867_21680 [Aphanomyces stellatus]